MPKMLYNIPNMLCYFRLAVIPFMIVFFYFDNSFTAWANVVLFALAGASDFFDGRIARATGQTTIFGKFLDSSTDKMLVGAALILLIAFDRLTGLWILPAIIIYLREILISGVREFMGLHNVIVPVSKLGKWKLTIQMFFIGFLIAGEYGEMLIPHAYTIGKIGFLFATVITVISGWDYIRSAWATLSTLDQDKVTE